ncbi:hypothetical protein TNCV_4898941 [Trichonephila clavipes]|nr:hypothetical protein TNCV_4898941 [Trichonephila clavipes]
MTIVLVSLIKYLCIERKAHRSNPPTFIGDPDVQKNRTLQESQSWRLLSTAKATNPSHIDANKSSLYKAVTHDDATHKVTQRITCSSRIWYTARSSIRRITGMGACGGVLSV